MWEKKKGPELPLASTLGTPSDLPTEAVPSQPAATSSGVSNAAGGPGGVAAADPSAHEEMTQIKEAIPSQKGIDAQDRVSVQWSRAKGGSYG